MIIPNNSDIKDISIGNKTKVRFTLANVATGSQCLMETAMSGFSPVESLSSLTPTNVTGASLDSARLASSLHEHSSSSTGSKPCSNPTIPCNTYSLSSKVIDTSGLQHKQKVVIPLKSLKEVSPSVTAGLFNVVDKEADSPLSSHLDGPRTTSPDRKSSSLVESDTSSITTNSSTLTSHYPVPEIPPSTQSKLESRPEVIICPSPDKVKSPLLMETKVVAPCTHKDESNLQGLKLDGIVDKGYKVLKDVKRHKSKAETDWDLADLNSIKHRLFELPTAMIPVKKKSHPSTKNHFQEQLDSGLHTNSSAVPNSSQPFYYPDVVPNTQLLYQYMTTGQVPVFGVPISATLPSSTDQQSQHALSAPPSDKSMHTVSSKDIGVNTEESRNDRTGIRNHKESQLVLEVLPSVNIHDSLDSNIPSDLMDATTNMIYEMVGNSVAYQLLLQPHPSISVELINSMYPVLKNLQGSAEWLYNDYLEMFKISLSKKATPQCLHPSDTPTVKFLIDLCVYASSLPMDDETTYISPNPSLWMHILSIFSISPQNQAVLVDSRSSSKVVGCMNLTSMADDIKLQCHGWEVLTNILQCPPRDINKPAIHIQAITLLLSHIRRQCEQFYHDDNLMRAILMFLSKLTSITRVCSLGNVQPSTDSDTPISYSKEDSLQIISLLEQTSIRKILLDLPEHLQDDLVIKTTLQSVLLSLAPAIVLPPDDTMATVSATPIKRFAPPKPKRSKIRSQYFNGNKENMEGARVPRKLPDIPNKRMSLSKSSEHLSDNHFDRPLPTLDSELSLPAGIISYVTTRRSSKKTKERPHNQHQDQVNQGSSGGDGGDSGSGRDSGGGSGRNSGSGSGKSSGGGSGVGGGGSGNGSGDGSGGSGSGGSGNGETQLMSKPRSLVRGPEQLPHYNRLSSKKRIRGSYIKAVTSSQRKSSSEEMKQDNPTDTQSGLCSQIEQGHSEITHILTERKEMVSSIMQLWKNGKTLQAASNLVMSCFFTDEPDVPLFIDCIESFCCYPAQWSLGICIVLLPCIKKIIIKDIKLRYWKVVNDMVSLIMKRFSVMILGVQKNKYSSRVHLEQRQACYHELHLLFATVVKIDQSGKPHSDEVKKFIQILTPFNDPLS